MLYIVKFYFILIFLFFSKIYCFKCGSNKLNIKPKIINLNKNLRNLDSENRTNHSIKFYIDYEIIEKQKNSNINDTIISSKYISFIKSTFNKTIKIFEKLLNVSSIQSVYIEDEDLKNMYYYGLNNILNESSLSKILNKNINADIIIVPFIYPLEETVDAAAFTYLIDIYANRPILGFVELRPNYDFSKKNSENFLSLLLLHEITHVLAFSNNLYSFFQIDENTKILDNKIINGINRTLLSTPKVVQAAQKHFNCSSITGIELENQGGEGSIGSHWEARTMLGDYMIAIDYPGIVISDITLSLFEDSGWYSVNYYTGGLFRFGKNMGCSFLNSTCLSNGTTEFDLDFCTISDEPRCSAGNLDRGICYLIEWPSDIENNYKYFNYSNIGGLFHADYCPVMINYPSNYYNFYSRCDLNSINNGYDNEIYSDNSICVLNSLVTSDNKKGKTRALCMEVECDYDNNAVLITLGNEIISCNVSGEFNIEGYKGSITCPNFNRVCTGSKWCNDVFSCVEQKSTTLESVYIEHYKKNYTEEEEEPLNVKKIKYLKKFLILFLLLI